jgi:type II secretion system protein J
MNRKQQGFTLIEMLIAVAIFAFISVITYSFLNASLKTTSGVNAHSERIVQLQKTLHFLQRDVSQLNQHDLSFNQQLLSLKTLQNEHLLNVRYKINNNQLVGLISPI